MTPDRPRSVWYPVGVGLRIVFDAWRADVRDRRQRAERARRRRALVRGLDRVCRSLAAQQGWATRRRRELLAELNRCVRRTRGQR